MPLKSKAQERFLWAKHPKIAQEFEDKTLTNAKLPEHVKKMDQGGIVDPESSEEWERIKAYVGGANKQSKHPIQQEMERMNRGGVAGYEEGGPVDFNQQANEILGTSPAELKTNLEQINRPTVGQTIGRGIAGASDALMQGVARAGTGNARESLDREIEQNRANLSGIPGKVAEMGKQQFGLSTELQERDPNSKLSKYAQDAYGPLGDRMGINLRGASAKMIGDITGKSIEQLKNEAQEKEARAIHEQTAAYEAGQQDIERQRLAEEARRNKVIEAETARAKPLEAAKELQVRPWYQKFIEGIPSGGLLTSESTKKLREEMNRNPNQTFTAPEVGQTILHPSGAKITRHR